MYQKLSAEDKQVEEGAIVEIRQAIMPLPPSFAKSQCRGSTPNSSGKPALCS
jgi:hypothetical protein